MIDPWIEEINERTDGRVQITAYHAQALGAQQDHYQMVLNRQADIVTSGGEEGILPLCYFNTLPFLFTSAEQAGAVSWQVYEKHLMNTEFKNVKLLWLIPLPPGNLSTNSIQVKTLEDFKGMKISTGSAITTQTLEALGATPTFIPAAEEYTAVERGLVDGLIANWEKFLVFKEMEVTKYRTEIKLQTNVMKVMMNLDAWNDLPADIQKIFDETTGMAFTRRCGAIFDENDIEIRAVIEGYDAQVGNPPIYDLPEDEWARWRDASLVVHEQWITDFEGEGLETEARAIVEDAKTLAKEFK